MTELKLQNKFSALFDVQLVVNMFVTCFKRRDNWDRAIVWICMLSLGVIVFIMGEYRDRCIRNDPEIMWPKIFLKQRDLQPFSTYMFVKNSIGPSNNTHSMKRPVSLHKLSATYSVCIC